MNADLFMALQKAIDSKESCAVVTNTATGVQVLLRNDDHIGDLDLKDGQVEKVNQMVANDMSGPIADTDLFVRVYSPPLRMAVVGAVHIAQALVPMAKLAGFEVTVIDPRESFMQAGRIDGVCNIKEWPDEGMKQLAPDNRTAVVTLTHDPKLDDPALAAALRSQAFYIGSLGSIRTHTKRLSRLKKDGFTDQDLERINGPVGLNIGAKTPAEIAIAIIGQVIEVRRALST